jgi:hypothetical protein
MATMATHVSDIVADPVSHISISGVHGRDELNERLAQASYAPDGDRGIRAVLGSILLGAAAGAAVMYLFGRR